jgi:hypothetical protein
MKHEQLSKHFEAIGARVKFRPLESPPRLMQHAAAPFCTVVEVSDV